MDDKERLVVDKLAAEIRRVDGDHTLGAGALAEALLPFMESLAGGEAVRLPPSDFLLNPNSTYDAHPAPAAQSEEMRRAEEEFLDRYQVGTPPSPAQPKDHSGEQRTVFEQATAIANSELTTLHEVIAAKQPAQAEGAEMERAARVLTAMADGHNVLWEDGLVNNREHYNSLLRLAASALRRQGQVTDEQVTEELVETACRAMWGGDFGSPTGQYWDSTKFDQQSKEHWRERVRLALTAALSARGKA